jgi:uncharacterized protein (DUF488 family)
MSALLWTIGHSTRPIEEFVLLLKAHGIRQLVDVRTIPKSRYNPQFNTEALAKRLAETGIAYRHAAGLGGLRKPKNDSINTGWRNESFRGYADYMQTEEFQRALEELMAYGTGIKTPFSPIHAGHAETHPFRTAVMCAEAVPWRCHRSLIADALVSRGWEVQHIMSETKADRHQMTSFAKVEHGMLSYPGSETAPLLF